MATPSNVQKNTIVLTKDRRPDSLFLDQLYDPDKDGAYVDSDDFPRLVPKEGALVVDRSDEGRGNLYYVESVDPETFKSTIRPVSIVSSYGEDTQEYKIISYGNDRFTLFVNKDHKPTQLTVSSNFVVFGSDLVRYQLYRYTKANEREIISVYLDSDENYQGNYIPLLPIMKDSPIKKCTNCHTWLELTDGETVLMDCYDATGVLRMTIRLFVMNETAINDLLAESDMVIGMDAVALQMLSDGTFFLYQRQDASHLGVTPKLKYYDGRYEEIAIDNESCFLYGLEGFVPTFTGQKQKIIIKKYLGPKQYAHSSISETSGGQRFVTCEKWITVIENEALDALKVSLIPVWNANQAAYFIKYIAYSDRRDKIIDVTNAVHVEQDIDTTDWGSAQRLHFTIDLDFIFGTSSSIPHQQVSYIKLQHYNNYERYLISDRGDMSVVYGSENPSMRRPVIFYDPHLAQYYIPTSRFRNKAAVLDSFYYAAEPPLNSINETEPPKPTHFTIRAIDSLNTLITTPIPMNVFNNAWTINRQGPSNMLVGANVIVEFLQSVGDGFNVLYGVPVDVYETRTPQGYVGEPQPIEN